MSNRLVKAATVAAVALGLVLGASAPSWAYIALKGGVYLPNKDDKGLNGADTGFGGGLAVGGNFGPGPVGFGLEGGATVFSVKPEGGGDPLLIVPLTLDAKLLIRPTDVLTLFVGGGAGYYIGYVTGDSEADVDERTAKGVGFQAVGGVEINLGSVGLLGEVKWSKADVEFDAGGKFNIGGTAILVGLTF